MRTMHSRLCGIFLIFLSEPDPSWGDLFDRTPLQHFSVGPDTGHYFASTPEVTEGDRNRLLIYMWSANLKLSFFDKSHEEQHQGIASCKWPFRGAFFQQRGRSTATRSRIEMEEGGL